jgi:hypothetical protein
LIFWEKKRMFQYQETLRWKSCKRTTEKEKEGGLLWDFFFYPPLWSLDKVHLGGVLWRVIIRKTKFVGSDRTWEEIGCRNRQACREESESEEGCDKGTTLA